MPQYLPETGAEVHAYASIKDRTSIEWVTTDDSAALTIGGLKGFELFATEQGLRNLVEAGTRALEAIEHR